MCSIGLIDFEDGPDHGAAFTVQLPIVPVDAIPSGIVDSTRPTEPHAIEHSLLHGISVLVVDDDADSRDLVAAGLQNAGAFVTLAESVATGGRAFVTAAVRRVGQ
jgi:hypothetical protein